VQLAGAEEVDLQSAQEKDHFEGSQFVFNAGAGEVSVDATFLIASLLVFAAEGDGSISQLESEKMVDTLCSRLGMCDGEAMRHLCSAVMHVTVDEDIVLRLHQIARNLSQAEKEAVFSMVLDIVTVDGQIDPGESLAVKSAGHILKLPQARINSALSAMSCKITPP